MTNRTNITESNGKLAHLESIRGLAALSVVFCHLLWAFYPFMNAEAPEQLAGHAPVAQMIARSPLRTFYDGRFAVMLFFVLSGFVLSRSFFSSRNREVLLSAAVRRYIRLAIPIAASVMIAFLLLKTDLFFNHEAAAASGGRIWLDSLYSLQQSFTAALKEGLYGAFFFFNGQTSLNPILWTMSTELFGSFLVFGFLAVFGNLRSRWLAYICVFAFLFYRGSVFYLDFLFGILLCDIHVSHVGSGAKFKLPAAATIVMLIAGVILGAQKTSFLPQVLQRIYVFPGDDVFKTAGAVLIISAALFSPPLSRLLGRRIFTFLGQISFSMYLLHIIVITSLVSFIYCISRETFGWTHGACAASASAIGLVALMLLSWIMYLYIDRESVRLGKRFYNFLFKRKKAGAESSEHGVKA